jgi:DNA-binding transcriptional MerR regulator
VRIGDLSRRSRVSVPTIKYYLREGLLPPGAATAANQATYSDAHLQRLRLIRALIEVGRLSVAAAREVLSAVDEPDLPPHSLLGAAHHAVTRVTPHDRDDPAWRSARAEVERLIGRRAWRVDDNSPAIDQAAEAIRTLRAIGGQDVLECLDTYADAAAAVAAKEVDVVIARQDPARMVEGVVTGTVLGEALLNALRLLAQQDVSARRLVRGPGERKAGSGPG